MAPDRSLSPAPASRVILEAPSQRSSHANPILHDHERPRARCTSRAAPGGLLPHNGAATVNSALAARDRRHLAGRARKDCRQARAGASSRAPAGPCRTLELRSCAPHPAARGLPCRSRCGWSGRGRRGARIHRPREPASCPPHHIQSRAELLSLFLAAGAEAHLLGEIRAGARVARRNHRIVVRQTPLFPVFLRGQIVVGPQMTLQ